MDARYTVSHLLEDMAAGLVAALTFLVTVIQCAPQITFPINSQVPPVGRIGQSYNFTFSQSTFFSTTPIKYELQNAPAWLVLDGDRRIFSGVPQSQGAAQFIVKATDQTGSSTMSTTFYVASDSGPKIGDSLSTLGETTAQRTGATSFSSYPSRPFSILFSPDNFGGKNLQYYATSADNTPLPSWIAFDPSALQFSGVAPSWSSLVSPPQIFGLRLIASDVPGFATASIQFNLVVGSHLLLFKTPSKTINAQKGVAFSLQGLRQDLSIDGQPVKDSEIVQATIQGPEWARLDNLTVSGTPPPTASSANITVKVVNTNGDSAKCTILINFKSMLFTGSIPDGEALTGRPFSYHIENSILSNDSNVAVSAVIDPPSSWLHFNAQSRDLTGDVPKDLAESDIHVNLTAKSGSMSDSQAFTISVKSTITKSNVPLSSAPAASTAPVEPSSSTSVDSSAGSRASRSTTRSTLLAIMIPLSILAVVVLLTLIFCHRRRKLMSRPTSPTQKAISKPMHENSSPESAYKAPLVAPVIGIWNSSRSLQHRRFANSDEEAQQNSPMSNEQGTTNFSKRIPPPRPARPDEFQPQPATLRLVSSGTISSENRPMSGMGHGSGRLSTRAPSSFASFDCPRGRRGNNSQALTVDSWQTETDTLELERGTINRQSLMSSRVKASISSIRSGPLGQQSSSRILRSALNNAKMGRGESPFFHSSHHASQQGSPTRGPRSDPNASLTNTPPRISDVLSTLTAQATSSTPPQGNISSNIASAGSSPPPSPPRNRHVQRHSALDAVIEKFKPQTHRRNPTRDSKSTNASQFRDASDGSSPGSSPRRHGSIAATTGVGRKRFTFGSGSPQSVQRGQFRLHRASGSVDTQYTKGSAGTADDDYLNYYGGEAFVGTAVTAQTLTPQLKVDGRASGNTMTSGGSGDDRLWGERRPVELRDVVRESIKAATTEGRVGVSPSLSVERGAFI
ncbi:MAG: hypothetical protein M1814_001733 [Vezdaea aestivalis]|nr:MAG: hypothetical protein M1814_001733 [Vezdaea aestivalis]